ncbi:hypothetical protein ACJW30_01G114700 [Castanea mollissima]
MDTPLLVDGVVDHKGRPVLRSNTGGWRSAYFTIGVEVAERFAYNGISSNLITYLTGPLGQSMATAADNVNMWSGTAMLLPLLGALVADSFLGRYRNILIASLIYILLCGLGLLTLSAMLPSLRSTYDYIDTDKITFYSSAPIAVGQGGHKPCVQAFGADQFDGLDPEERKAKSSFFNWWYFGVCGGGALTILVLCYIQENLSWGLGFGIPCILMVVALGVFLLGSWYLDLRHSVKGDEKSPFLRIEDCRTVICSHWTSLPLLFDELMEVDLLKKTFNWFLNKALLSPDGLNEEGEVCAVSDIEEAKAVLRLVPIWVTSLGYAVVYAQISTFFTKQGATMDRTIFSGFEIPAASLQSFVGLSIILVIPIYDRIFVPIARAFTRKPSGITMLKTAEEYKLVDMPGVTIPMSVWWLLPQYILSEIADVFTMVGLQEFFYDQAPIELRSVGLALYLMAYLDGGGKEEEWRGVNIFGVGSFISSFLVSVIEEVTGRDGKDSWFADTLNRAHLDYFYWLLAGLSAVILAAYVYFAKSYIYNRQSTT